MNFSTSKFTNHLEIVPKYLFLFSAEYSSCIELMYWGRAIGYMHLESPPLGVHMYHECRTNYNIPYPFHLRDMDKLYPWIWGDHVYKRPIGHAYIRTHKYRKCII